MPKKAVADGAYFIVTGDGDLLALDYLAGISFVTPARFLTCGWDDD